MVHLRVLPPCQSLVRHPVYRVILPGSDRSGTPLSRDAVERLVTKHTRTAAATCPSPTSKHVTPHTLRHSTAMALLHAGVDISVIAL